MANRPPAPPPRSPEKQRYVTISISPLHYLVFAPLQFAFEVRPVTHVGVAVVGAYGQISAHQLDANEYWSFDAYKVGAQVVDYPMRGHTFDGPELGAEVLYAHVMKPVSAVVIDPGNDGLAIGPLVGYKVIANIGLTFVSQLGVEYVTARSHPYGLEQGTKKVGEGNHFAPLFNIDIGWSF